MNALALARDRIARSARTQHQHYAGEEDRPLGGYLMTMTGYAAVVGVIAAGADLLQFGYAWLQQASES